MFESRCHTLKLLAEVCVKWPCEEVSAGIALCNIKGQNLFGNIETGLQMLFSSVILLWMFAMNRGRLIFSVFWLAYIAYCKETKQDQFREVVLHGETLMFINTAIVATTAEVGSSSTFHETHLATEAKKIATMLHVRCNTSWNLYHSAIAHKFQLKVSPFNSGLRHCFFSSITFLMNNSYYFFAVPSSPDSTVMPASRS